MKLGIVVVYLVSDRMGPLLDLHLRKIEECTDVPYTVYGSVNRLQPEYRHILDSRRDVKTFEERERVIVRFAGDSGDGMQLAGSRFTDATAVLVQQMRALLG